MKDHPAVTKYARSFARNSGMEEEDLLQEARMAWWYAITWEKYDPHKASMNTFITGCTHRHLCTITERHKRRALPVQELTDWLPDRHTPKPDRQLLLAELIRELPSDARTLVNLVFSDPQAMELITSKARTYFCEKLGLPRSRINRAIEAIAKMLREIGD